MSRKFLFFIIVGIAILIGVLILSQRKTIKIEKETEEELTLQEGETMEEKEIKNKKTQIITIYDNYQVNPELETGWGFSCLVRQSSESEGGFSILFDTGADSPTLLSNMEKLGIKPDEIDIVVLSHIHGDHIGGLTGFLGKNKNVKIYIPASFPDSIREGIESHEAEYQDVKESVQISETVFSTGELGTWVKEQSLIIDTEKGIIVITGCAHPGIVNIVERAKELLQKEVYLVLGGFHLSGASDPELKSIINNFRKIGVQKVAPCHCSGDRCRQLFGEGYKENFIENGVGKIIEI